MRALGRKRLLLINQTVGPLFMGVVSAVARLEPTTLFLGSSTVALPPGVRSLGGVRYWRSSALRRLGSWGLFSLQLGCLLLSERIRGLLLCRRYRRLLIVSNPPFAPLLAPLAGCPYALLLYDLYPDVLAQLGSEASGHSRKSLTGRALGWVTVLWRWLNRRVYGRAEAVFTLSPGMAASLRSCFADEASWRQRVHVVPPWADTRLIRPIPPEHNDFRRQQGLVGSFVVLYSGNLGLTHPLELLLEAFARIAGRSSSIELVLIGDGPKRRLLERQAAVLRLAALRFIDPLPIEQVSHSYSAADLAVVCLDGPAAHASLPSKTFTALATGTPILALAPPGSELAALVQRHQCGVVVPPGPRAAAAIAELLAELSADPEHCRTMARQALLASRSYGEANADRLVDIWLGSPSAEGPVQSPRSESVSGPIPWPADIAPLR